MGINKEAYNFLSSELLSKNVTLVAVSKTKTKEEILELYELGQRDFGENYVQEMVDKQAELPADIRWHFIGHLQSNKIKLIIPFVQLIQGVDSLKLLKAIDKEAGKQGKIVRCLLQVHIASEETKFGLDETELQETISQLTDFKNVEIHGLMGMASFVDNEETIRSEFKKLKELSDRLIKPFRKDDPGKPLVLSMGMSSDYKTALEEGSNMVRIGSLIFGQRS